MSGVKNSSAHEGVRTSTPSKSTSIVSLFLTSLKVGVKASYASLPEGRDTNVVPNFLRLIIILI